MGPIAARARFHALVDPVSTVDSPHIVDRGSHVLQSTVDPLPLSNGRAEYSTQQK